MSFAIFNNKMLKKAIKKKVYSFKETIQNTEKQQVKNNKTCFKLS